MVTIAEVLSQRWLIHRTEVISYLPLLVSFLNGNKINAEAIVGESGRPAAYSRNAGGDFVATTDLTNSNLPDNSIAVIPIQGVIYPERTRELLMNLKMAESNPSFIAVVYMVNTPGGTVFMTDLAADAIKNSPLPSVAFIMNMAASAGMWLTSAMTQRYASSKIDRIGSIGTKTSFMDINGLLKDRLGITVYDIYATKSVKKDNEIRALLAGDEKPLRDDLDFVNDIFHAAIMENLGINEDSEVFSGDIYNATRAQELGLIDGIASLDTVLDIAYSMGIDSQIKSLSNHFNSQHR